MDTPIRHQLNATNFMANQWNMKMGLERLVRFKLSNTRFLGEADKLCYGFGLHLPHNTAAMNLYSLKGSSPFIGNLLTKHPFSYETKNFKLSGR
jgi:hypothetical protein